MSDYEHRNRGTSQGGNMGGDRNGFNQSRSRGGLRGTGSDSFSRSGMEGRSSYRGRGGFGSSRGGNFDSSGGGGGRGGMGGQGRRDFEMSTGSVHGARIGRGGAGPSFIYSGVGGVSGMPTHYGDDLKSPGTIRVEQRESFKNALTSQIASRNESRNQSTSQWGMSMGGGQGMSAMAKLDAEEEERVKLLEKEMGKTTMEVSTQKSDSTGPTPNSTDEHVSTANHSPSSQEKPEKRSPQPTPLTATTTDFIPPTKGPEICAETVNSGEVLYSHWARHLSGMLDDEEFTDCVIQVGEETVKAHKCILSRYSPVFREKFAGATQPKEGGGEKGKPEEKERKQKKTHVVKAEGYSPDAIRAMLGYLYSGHVGVEEMGKMGAELLRLAFDYQLTGLKHFVAHHLSSTVTVANALDLAKVADTHSVPELFKACCRVLLSNCDGILDGDEWKGLVAKDGSLAAKLLTEGLLDKSGKKEDVSTN